MNASEILLQAFSQLLFFRELHMEELCYLPENKQDPELPDLVVSLGNTMLVMKLEIRQPEDGQPDENGEDPWLEEIYSAGRIALRSVLARLRDRDLPGYRNCRGQELMPGEKIAAFPMLILGGVDPEQNYPRLLEQYSPEGVIANCTTLEELQTVLGMLAVPMELLHFLYYRACYYGDLKTVTSSFQDKKDKLGRILPVPDPEMVHRFLRDKFGYTQEKAEKFQFESLKNFLQELPEKALRPEKMPHVERFITHLARGEMADFVERLQMLGAETRRGSKGLLSSLRPKDDQYAIFFVAGDQFPLEVLRQMIINGTRLKDIMEVVGCLDAEKNFKFDFILEEDL